MHALVKMYLLILKQLWESALFMLLVLNSIKIHNICLAYMECCMCPMYRLKFFMRTICCMPLVPYSSLIVHTLTNAGLKKASNTLISDFYSF